MKKSARIIGYAFRYFSYFLGASTIYVCVTDPEYMKERSNAAYERGLSNR